MKKRYESCKCKVKFWTRSFFLSLSFFRSFISPFLHIWKLLFVFLLNFLKFYTKIFKGVVVFLSFSQSHYKVRHILGILRDKITYDKWLYFPNYYRQHFPSEDLNFNLQILNTASLYNPIKKSKKGSWLT